MLSYFEANETEDRGVQVCGCVENRCMASPECVCHNCVSMSEMESNSSSPVEVCADTEILIEIVERKREREIQKKVPRLDEHEQIAWGGGGPVDGVCMCCSHSHGFKLSHS